MVAFDLIAILVIDCGHMAKYSFAKTMSEQKTNKISTHKKKNASYDLNQFMISMKSKAIFHLKIKNQIQFLSLIKYGLYAVGHVHLR